jgi:hypothetical protein
MSASGHFSDLMLALADVFVRRGKGDIAQERDEDRFWTHCGHAPSRRLQHCTSPSAMMIGT